MAEFFSKELLVVELIVWKTETIFMGLSTPARLLACAAFGTALRAGGNCGAADRAVEIFLRCISPGHLYESFRILRTETTNDSARAFKVFQSRFARISRETKAEPAPTATQPARMKLGAVSGVTPPVGII
jgi:hypothetical protein